MITIYDKWSCRNQICLLDMKRKTRKVRYGCAVYSVTEAGDLLGISRNSAYAAAKDGSLPVIKVGGLLKVPKAVLDKMLGAVA